MKLLTSYQENEKSCQSPHDKALPFPLKDQQVEGNGYSVKNKIKKATMKFN